MVNPLFDSQPELLKNSVKHAVRAVTIRIRKNYNRLYSFSCVFSFLKMTIEVSWKLLLIIIYYRRQSLVCQYEWFFISKEHS